MTHKDFHHFTFSLNINIEIDNYLRRITEKIKLLSQLRDVDLLSDIPQILADTNSKIDNLISDNFEDESKE